MCASPQPPDFLSLSKSSFLILAKDECNPAEPFVACSVFSYFFSSFALTRPIPVLHARFSPTIIKRMLHAALHAVWQSSEEQNKTHSVSRVSLRRNALNIVAVFITPHVLAGTSILMRSCIS